MDAHAEAAWPDRRYAWWVVVVLLLTYTNSYLDRQMLSLLIEPLRRDLHINDTQVSLLAGIAFALFYAVAGVPLAWVADRWNRRRLILLGSAAWSCMTALCGIAGNFGQLFACRIGVGVGEASLSPATFSLLADYFPKERLATPIAVFSTAVYIGAGLAMMIGGAVVKVTMHQPDLVLPLIGVMPAWKLAFVYVAALGIPTTLLLLTVREPVRRGLAKTAAPSGPSLAAFVTRNRATLLGHFLGYGFYALAVAAFLFWTPALFVRTYGWSAPQIGWAFGAILMTLGAGGVFTGGRISDLLLARGVGDAALQATIWSGLITIPLAIFTCLAPNGALAIAGLCATIFFISIQGGLPPVVLQLVTPNPLRARVASFYFVIISLIGAGFGSTAVALVTDYVFKAPEALRYSMAIIPTAALALASVILTLTRRPYAASLDRAERGFEL